MSWESVRADVFCESVRDGTHDTPKEAENGYKLVTAKHIRDGQVYPEEAYNISEKDYLKICERSKVEQWDVLMSMIGNGLGRSAVVQETPSYAIKNLALFKVGDEVKARWLHYFLSSEVGQGMIYNSLQGSGQPFISLNLLRAFPIPTPQYAIMKSVVDIVSKYDELIENNQKQIKLLEEAAQRLYKEWFVDLRFPGHETTPITDGIPEGWKRCLLSDVIGYEIGGGWGEEEPTEKCDIPAYVIRGTDLYGISHGDAMGIPYRYHAQKNLDARKLVDGDIVFEVSGGSKTEGVARTALIGSEMLEQWGDAVMCASFCKLIRVKDQDHAQLLFDAFQYMRASEKTTEYDKRSASSIVNYRWKDFLATEAVLIPDENMLAKYNALALNMYQMIIQKSIAIEKAKDARDRLLPKLMNGEIEV